METPPKNWKTRVAALARTLGPYAAIELVMPGGSVVAIALWAYRLWKHPELRP